MLALILSISLSTLSPSPSLSAPQASRYVPGTAIDRIEVAADVSARTCSGAKHTNDLRRVAR